MTYNYKSELEPFLEKTEREIMDYVKGALANADSDSVRKVQELSHMLRHKRNPVTAVKTAVEVAEKLYSEFSTPYNLNLYLVAAVDAQDEEKIRALEKEAAKVLQNPDSDAEHRLHLYTTCLKAANRIRDNAMFERIYKEIPSAYKTGNNYIVNQYYIYLVRKEDYQGIVSHYDSLDSVTKANEKLQERFRDAVTKIGPENFKPSVFLIGTDSRSPDFQLTTVVLDNLVQVIPVTGDTTSEIVQEMDKNTLGNSFAVVLGKDFDEFAWGYFFGKVGASNLVILMNEELIKGDVAKKEVADSVTSHGLKGFSLFSLPDMKDLTKWKNELLECMKLSGLKIS